MIQESVRQQTEPLKVLADSNGIPIESGKKVAFNKSGAVLLGEIVQLKRSEWRKNIRDGWWFLKFELIVKNRNDGTESRIKNPNSFIIIS